MHGGINRTAVIKKAHFCAETWRFVGVGEHDEYGTYTLMPENLAFGRRFISLQKSLS